MSPNVVEYEQVSGVPILKLNGQVASILCEGSRLTGLVGNLVVKLDYRVGTQSSENQCALQKAKYESLSPEDRELVPKLLDCGTIILDGVERTWIIEEFHPLLESVALRTDEAIERVKNFAVRNRNWDVPFNRNWAISGRTMQPVIYDYVL